MPALLSVFWKVLRCPKTLMIRCAELGMPAMACFDRNGLYGAPRFHVTAEKLGLRAHIGAEIADA